MRDTFKAAVPALALLTALTAACGESAGGAPSPTGSAPAATTPAATTPAAAPSSTATAVAGGGTAKCAADNLKVSIAEQGTGKTDETGLVIITNTGTKNCTLHGWLTITLVNAADEPAKVPTTKVNEPGPAETVEVKAGGSAFAGIKWTQCSKDDVSCGVGNTIRWSLDGSRQGPVADLEGFPAPEKSGITMKALKIGTIQPSNQGVVAW